MWLLWLHGLLWQRLWRRGISASLLLLLLLGADRLSIGMRARTHATGALGLGRGTRGIDLGVWVRLQDLGSGGRGLGLLERRGCELVAGLLGLVLLAREARSARMRRVRVGEWRVRWGVPYGVVLPEGRGAVVAADAVVEGSRVCEDRLCVGWVRRAGLRW